MTEKTFLRAEYGVDYKLVLTSGKTVTAYKLKSREAFCNSKNCSTEYTIDTVKSCTKIK